MANLKVMHRAAKNETDSQFAKLINLTFFYANLGHPFIKIFIEVGFFGNST